MSLPLRSTKPTRILTRSLFYPVQDWRAVGSVAVHSDRGHVGTQLVSAKFLGRGTDEMGGGEREMREDTNVRWVWLKYAVRERHFLLPERMSVRDGTGDRPHSGSLTHKPRESSSDKGGVRRKESEGKHPPLALHRPLNTVCISTHKAASRV
jgi:hypothetical protein